MWQMRTLNLAIVGVLVLGASAWAQKAKYTRQQDVKVEVKLSDRVKPIVAKTPDAKDQQPELSADQVLSIEGLVGDIRNEQEQILADLITNTPDSEVEEKSDYYFRLGELYAKQQRYWRLKGVEMTIQSDQTRNAQQKNKLKNDATVAAGKAKDYLLKAVKTYKGLTDNDAFRNYPKMDMALFYYGYTLQGGKYMKEARSVYDKLLKNYPNSKYVPEAHLAFADYFFENNQLDDAEARYRMVLKFPKSPAYWYAMYKMGWIDLNKQRFQDALETFFQVAQATRNDKKQEVLNRASKKDFVRAYAEVGKADKAYSAFQRVDAKYAFEMLEILADLYLSQGKSDKAIYVYQELMKQAPTNKNVCLWQYNVAHATLSMAGAGNADKVKEIENLVRLWGALKGKKTLPVSEAQECHDNAAAMSGELARAYHSESAKTKNPETLAYADKLYHVYLQWFPDAEDFAQTQYFYAELIWSRAENEKNPRLATEQWENAALAFTDVVKNGKVEPRLMKESAYAAVLGWKNALNVDPRVKQQADMENSKADKKAEPKPIPEREQKMLAAFDIYINYIKDPKDDELVGMKFLKANIYRRYNHYEEAIPIFMDILEHHKQHETAEYSANLLLDTYNSQQRYDDMLALVDKLDGDAKFLEGKDDLKATLAKLKGQSLRKRAENMEKVAKDSNDYGKYVACGQAYMDIYNRNPESPENDEVLYNAGVCFGEGKSIGAEISAYNVLEKYYPNSKLTAKAVALLGKAYGDIAYYDRASDKLEQYAKKYGGEKNAYDAMSDAVFFRKGIGDDAKAIEDTKYFIKTFGSKKPQEAANAMFSLTGIYEKQGDLDVVIKHLRDYIRQFGERGGADRVVVAYAKIGQILWHQSCPVKEVDGSCVRIIRERAISSKKTKKTKKGVVEQPLQCGPESKIKLTVVKRDERKQKEALQAFAAAAKEYERRQGKIGGEEAAARYYYGIAKIADADKEFEAYLQLKFPSGLNFDPAPEHKAIAAKSRKRFDEWMTQKQKIGGIARNKYDAVLAIKDPANSITAAARIGQIAQNFSDALFTAEIPNNVRTGEFADEKVEAFCDALTEKAEPLEALSLEAYGVCLAKSTELGWFSEWSKLCERELGQIKPEEYPTASELRGDPNQVAPVTEVEPPIKLD
jgi:tetratricopeptide (TPR) repeat protein